jgi:hypothetical protein
MAAERRAANETRFQALEEGLEAVRYQVGGLKRRVDQVMKCTTLIVEGATRAEELWQTHIAKDRPEWREFKQKLGEALVRDWAEHLGVAAWPLNGEQPEVGLLRSLHGCLGAADVIRNVHGQDKWSEANQARVRMPETFLVQLTFCAETLEIGRCLKGIDKQLRRASGLRVDGDVTMQDGAVPPKKRVAYLEKTQAERERAKGRGKGAGAVGGGAPPDGAGGGGAGAGAPPGGGAAAAAAPAQPAHAGAPAGAQKGGKGRGKKGGKGKGKGRKGGRG